VSIINTAAPYRRDDRQAVRVPVVMPLVEVTISETGYLTVTLDREPYSADGTWQRDDLKRVLDEIAADLGTPVRVEVHEADGSTFTDIVTPDRPQLCVVEPAPLKNAPSVVRGVAGRVICGVAGEVSGGGFFPNEEVAIAVVVAHQVASSDGTARLRLPPALLEAHPGLVVLMGTKSGTVSLSGEVG
jgi:hypothetical protein